MRTLTIINNRGKAAGFNSALGFAKGEFILSNDADSKPEVDALWKYMYYFEREGGAQLGAVTGNMLSINKTTLVAEAQQWDMQTAGWQACFAPHIRFFMDVPETHYRNSLSNGEDGLPVGFTCS